MTTTLQRGLIRLRSRDEGSHVLVEPENEDRFVMTTREAAMACQRHEEIKAFGEQFRALLNELGSWLRDNGAKVERAFITLRDGGILFLIIRNDVPFDVELEDELTRLDIAVAQDSDFDLLDVNILALPRTSEESYSTFLDPRCSWAYGE